MGLEQANTGSVRSTARLAGSLMLAAPPKHSHTMIPLSQVARKGMRYYLGQHASEEAAARAYDQGAICLLVR